MKLALVVLSCFVCLSQQERYIWPFPFAPNQASFKPLFYGNGLPAGYDIMKHDDSQVTVYSLLYFIYLIFKIWSYSHYRCSVYLVCVFEICNNCAIPNSSGFLISFVLFCNNNPLQ